MEPLQHGRPAAGETLDHRQLPQRPGPVEGHGRQLGRQVEQLALLAGRGDRQAPEVVPEVEVGVVGPLRRRQPERRTGHPLAQRREHVDGPFQPARRRRTSGADSSRVMLVKSVRRNGSDSTTHMMASASFILAAAIG